MMFNVSVCSLLICAALGLLVGADPIRTKFTDADEVVINNEDNEEILEIVNDLRMIDLRNEMRLFPRGLQVYNDDGELRELDLSEDIADDESEEESSRRLPLQVLFQLYTKKNPQKHQSLWLNDRKALAKSNFNASNPTHFITHGWVNTGKSPACTLIRDAYLRNYDFNVIVVNWQHITLRPYLWASSRVKMVGQHVSKMINFLETHAELNTDKTTLVGHSLGAHVMGLAGYYAKGTIHYVIGLDPALPMFMFAGPGSRISVEDAKHVQIIHTNAGLLGYKEAIGHSDFYPNGGTKQLGCLIDIGGACSHARSYEFFAESINTPIGFYGKPCSTFEEFVTGKCTAKQIAAMGGALINFPPADTYYLATKSNAPFAKGH